MYHATLTSHPRPERSERPIGIGLLPTDDFMDAYVQDKTYANWHCDGSVTLWQLVNNDLEWRPVVTVKADKHLCTECEVQKVPQAGVQCVACAAGVFIC